MRRQSYKFHIIAIGCISLVTVGLYYAVGPKKMEPVDPTIVRGDRYIEIYSATWGEKCNSMIARFNAQQQQQPPQKDEAGKLIPQKQFEQVALNNVLSQVSAMCNGKLTCDVQATSDALGVEPLESCPKKLEFSYRCFSFDRLWPVSLDQGQTQTISCDAKNNTSQQ